MKDSVNKLKVFTLSALGLTLLCTLLFTISMFVSFDADVGYFAKSPITVIQKAIAAVSVIFFASIMFFIPKSTLPCDGFEGDRSTVFSSLLCGLVFIGGMIITFLSTYNSAANLSSTQRSLFMIITASGIIASIYFISDALTPSQKNVGIKVATAILVIVNLLCSVIFEHLDLFVPINAPRKTLLFLSFVSASVFIIQELRFKVGIYQPRAYVFAGSATALLCSVMSIPSLIAHYAGVFKDSSFLVYYLIGLALAIYTSARLISYTMYVDKNTSEE